MTTVNDIFAWLFPVKPTGTSTHGQYIRQSPALSHAAGSLLPRTRAFVEPDRIHVGGEDRQPDLFDQRVCLGPVDQYLATSPFRFLGPASFRGRRCEAAAMGNTTARTILEAQAADHFAGNLSQDDELARAIDMFLNPLSLLILVPVELVGLQPEERGFREDSVDEGDQLDGVVGLG